MHIISSGFSKYELNGIYTFTGNSINGRHLYVEQNKVYGIWFDTVYGNWVIGWMSNLAEVNGYAWGYNEDTFCPSLSKEWKEWWNNQWGFLETVDLQCVV